MENGGITLENRQGHRQRQTSPSTSLLAGRLIDHQGRRLIPSHSQKQAKRYRYYVSEPLVIRDRNHAPDGLRVPAQELETVVVDALRNWLVNTDAVLQALTGIRPEQVQSSLAQSQQLAKDLDEAAKQYSAIQRLVQQVIVEPQSVQIVVRPAALLAHDAAASSSAHQPTLTLAVSEYLVHTDGGLLHVELCEPLRRSSRHAQPEAIRLRRLHR